MLVWYSSVTIYVGIRGAFDIKHMLRKLAAQHDESEGGSVLIIGDFVDYLLRPRRACEAINISPR